MRDDDREDDPFEAFDEVDDREGDPFEAFDRATESSAGDPDDGSSDPAPLDAGVDSSRTGDELDSDPLSEMGPPNDDPFGDFAEREGDPFGGEENVFERVDVGEVDADRVWEEIAGDGEQGAPTTGSRYADVSKHRYCETCEHFSEPPDVHCTNEGTEIVEFVDVETVRLLDCPVVAEQRELADEE